VGICGRKLDVAKQVGISLRRLATSDTFLTIAQLFGVSIATVSKTVRRFINAMILRASHFIKWPINEDLNLVKMKFERIRSIPQVRGAFDSTHMEAELPGCSRSTDYFDKDKDYSYVVQAIVDTDMRFLDVFAGFFDVVHDLRILRNSGFFQLVEGGNRLNGQKQQIQGKWIPELIVGDFGYTQLEWMLVPLPWRNLHGIYDDYNYK
jgi:hypothetical protein